ncbi:hypothetical protein ACLVWU_04800 [Bdellovibrio sp. HCB290]|uniref:hypothetical protein n=1 Tax=Bdellovibrio sp. HCB290 TaxID=3394356 RepID=UPI0039B5A9D8
MRKTTKYKVIFLAQLIAMGLPFFAYSNESMSFKAHNLPPAANSLNADSSVDTIQVNKSVLDNDDEQKTLEIFRLEKDRWQEIKGMKIRNYLQGGQDLGGGNTYEAEFKSIGQYLLTTLRGFANSEINTDKLDVAVRDVKIIATNDRLVLNGTERHAINSLSKKVIVLSSQNWKKLTVAQKKTLVLHEYLRFCEVDDSNYTISGRWAAAEKLTLIPPAVANIYHQIDLPKSVWEIEGRVAGTKMDLEPTEMVYVAHDSAINVKNMPVFRVFVADPILTTQTVYYGSRWLESLYSESELPKAEKCLKKLSRKEPLMHFVVGERHMNIIDCW